MDENVVLQYGVWNVILVAWFSFLPRDTL